MSFRRRLSVLALLFILALAAYGTARHHAPALAAYVVEQALIQKSPEGAEPSEVRMKLRLLLDTAPDKDGKLAELLHLSQYLEKVQRLTPAEMERLLRRSDLLSD